MRPAGCTRIALLAALQAGAVGTFDVLARHAGVPEQQARQTLDHLRREGVVSAHRPESSADGQPQRQRAIYIRSANDSPNDSPFDALSFASQVWR